MASEGISSLVMTLWLRVRDRALIYKIYTQVQNCAHSGLRVGWTDCCQAECCSLTNHVLFSFKSQNLALSYLLMVLNENLTVVCYKIYVLDHNGRDLSFEQLSV